MQDNASGQDSTQGRWQIRGGQGRPGRPDKLLQVQRRLRQASTRNTASEILAFNAAVAGVEHSGRPKGLPSENGEADPTKATKANASDSDRGDRAGRLRLRLGLPAAGRKLSPAAAEGFVLAALMGAVVSSLAAMLNAASTIFTMDVYREYINRNASQANLVLVGRAVCSGRRSGRLHHRPGAGQARSTRERSTSSRSSRATSRPAC